MRVGRCFHRIKVKYKSDTQVTDLIPVLLSVFELTDCSGPQCKRPSSLWVARFFLSDTFPEQHQPAGFSLILRKDVRMLKHESSVCTFTASMQGKSMLSAEWRADQTRTSECLAWRGRSLLLKLGEKEEAAWWKGVRVRLVKSREAVILHGWREKVSTWSQRSSASSPSPPLRSLR